MVDGVKVTDFLRTIIWANCCQYDVKLSSVCDVKLSPVRTTCCQYDVVYGVKLSSEYDVELSPA